MPLTLIKFIIDLNPYIYYIAMLNQPKKLLDTFDGVGMMISLGTPNLKLICFVNNVYPSTYYNTLAPSTIFFDMKSSKLNNFSTNMC
jgi:hypothetical protein